MSFRKEKKFRLSKFELESLKHNLYNKGMQMLYPQRVINSLYYDTELNSMFNDSEEGIIPRKKVRIRWYDDIRKANKEVKISGLEGRFKISGLFNIPSENLLPQSLSDTSYGLISPSMFVSYTRQYFSFESMRITFDSHIQYSNHRQARSVFHKDSECVMEVKIGLEYSDDYIASRLPFSPSRFSKYCRGLLISNREI